MSAGDIITTFSIWLLLIVEAYADGLNMINNLYIQTTCIVKDPVKSISSHYLDQALKQIFFFFVRHILPNEFWKDTYIPGLTV